jgi:hypothetical protein
MRDFYDIHALVATQLENIDPTVLRDAFANTSEKRGSTAVMHDAALIVTEVETSPEMVALWNSYRSKFDYAANIGWDGVMRSIKKLCEIAAIGDKG